MNELNCPNCGAPIKGDECEYCGTVFRQRKNEEENTILLRQRRNEINNTYEIYGSPFQCSTSNFAAALTDLAKATSFSFNEIREMAGLKKVGK